MRITRLHCACCNKPFEVETDETDPVPPDAPNLICDRCFYQLLAACHEGREEAQ
jgi:hypothetical protein